MRPYLSRHDTPQNFRMRVARAEDCLSNFLLRIFGALAELGNVGGSHLAVQARTNREVLVNMRVQYATSVKISKDYGYNLSMYTLGAT